MPIRSTRTAPAIQPITWSAAVQPAAGVQFQAESGYRPERYKPIKGLPGVPTLAIAADRNIVFPLFTALLEPLGGTVDLILESSHFRENGKHRDYKRRGLGVGAVCCYLNEFDDMLADDGCTGVAVMSGTRPAEVQFDEHKSIVVYAADRRPFREVLHRFGLARHDELVLISEVKHIHRTTYEFADMFRDLARRFGMM